MWNAKVSSRIWTRVTLSISYDGYHYTTNAFLCMKEFMTLNTLKTQFTSILTATYRKLVSVLCCILRQLVTISWLKVTTHVPSSPSSVYLWSIRSLCQSKSRPQRRRTTTTTPAAGMLFYANSGIRNLHTWYVSSRETRDRLTITSAFGSEHIFYCPTRKAQSYTLWSRR